ncbi:MAG: hypothetical protein HZA62_07485 [Rhodocyclales bacterium]|nr:hypothetical protein [Rhodocyclales bacterium]
MSPIWDHPAQEAVRRRAAVRIVTGRLEGRATTAAEDFSVNLFDEVLHVLGIWNESDAVCRNRLHGRPADMPPVRRRGCRR